MATRIESGIVLDPDRVTGTFSQGLAGISDALAGLAVVLGATAVIITVIRGFLAAGNEKAGVALVRIARIVLTVSLISFFSWGAVQVAAAMGF